MALDNEPINNAPAGAGFMGTLSSGLQGTSQLIFGGSVQSYNATTLAGFAVQTAATYDPGDYWSFTVPSTLLQVALSPTMPNPSPGIGKPPARATPSRRKC